MYRVCPDMGCHNILVVPEQVDISPNRMSKIRSNHPPSVAIPHDIARIHKKTGRHQLASFRALRDRIAGR